MADSRFLIPSSEIVRKVYRNLLRYYGPQGWWPLRSRRIDFVKNIVSTLGFNSGGYHPGRVHEFSERDVFEIAAGAILTQNTNWNNAASALDRLIQEGLISFDKIKSIEQDKLALLIKSSGCYNQKAARLKRIASLLKDNPEPSRKELLSLTGIGPETADTIMLYAYNKPYFIIDAYTRKIFSRITGIEELNTIDYDTLRERVETIFRGNFYDLQEYHALLVIHAKKFCLKIKKCGGCPLERLCKK